MLQDVMEIDPATVQLSVDSMEYETDSHALVSAKVGFGVGTETGAMALDDGMIDDAACEDAPTGPSFADELLAALATMAMRSKRRQADLCAALCRGRLDTDPRRVTDALRQLERSGCIEHLVPLYDGGVLMSVTSRGIEKLSAGPRWNMLDGAGFLRK